MQAGRLKSAADVRDIGNRIQIAEYAIAIYENDIGVQRFAGIDASEAEAFTSCPRLD